jgi:hypothetical protein
MVGSFPLWLLHFGVSKRSLLCWRDHSSTATCDKGYYARFMKNAIDVPAMLADQRNEKWRWPVFPFLRVADMHRVLYPHGYRTELDSRRTWTFVRTSR